MRIICLLVTASSQQIIEQIIALPFQQEKKKRMFLSILFPFIIVIYWTLLLSHFSDWLLVQCVKSTDI